MPATKLPDRSERREPTKDIEVGRSLSHSVASLDEPSHRTPERWGTALGVDGRSPTAGLSDAKRKSAKDSDGLDNIGGSTDA